MNVQFLIFISCIYFFLPAYFTNATPPLVRNLKFLGKTIDGGRKFRGAAILGSHKTWRGAVLGIAMGMLTAIFQFILYNNFRFFQEISFVNFQEINVLLFGFLISFGAVFGDLLFSFLKRQLKKKPGQRWLPFDQTDYVIGAAIFLSPFLKLDFVIWIFLFVITFFLHITFNRLGYWLGLHPNKW